MESRGVHLIIGTHENQLFLCGNQNSKWGEMIFQYTFREDLSVSAIAQPGNLEDREEIISPVDGYYKWEGEYILIYMGKPGRSVKGEILGDSLIIRDDDGSEPVVLYKNID